MQKPDLRQYPTTPGVYLYKDASGRIIYVGKARRLRQRLASYFREESALTPKTRAMLSHAASLDILRTGSEKEALLLEASLIKKHRPRYNIVLRDDKEYLLFHIGTGHPFPRVEILRHKRSGKRKEGKVFGPFSSGGAARETWRILHRYFPLRRCRDAAFANRTRPCLYQHMGQCLGPCVLPVSQEEYRALLRKVELLLEGRSHELLNLLREEMRRASDALAFERAAKLRDQLRAVERTVERQSVVLPNRADLDIVGVAQTPEGLALGVLFVRDGLLTDGRNFFWPGLTVEDTPELLLAFPAQFYIQGGAPVPPRLVVPWLPMPGTMEADAEQAAIPSFSSEDDTASAFAALENALGELRGSSIHVSAAHGPDEDRLVLMAAANAREAARTASSPRMESLLAERLHMGRPARRIEVVDISHTGGRQTRAGMVVFEDEKPLRSAYRAYKLDEEAVAPGDDYAALAAWAVRRAASGPPWADLVLIDGGKGQLAAVESAFIRAGVREEFALASIAKARDEEGRADRRAGNTGDRIFLPGRSNPVNIRSGSPELLFLQRIRDAAHDFVLGRHKKARAAAALSGELIRLPGVGPALAKTLFSRFGSLAAMAEAGEEGLLAVPGIGKSRAALIHARLVALLGR